MSLSVNLVLRTGRVRPLLGEQEQMVNDIHRADPSAPIVVFISVDNQISDLLRRKSQLIRDMLGGKTMRPRAMK